MSNLKVIKGENVTSIAPREREARELEREISSSDEHPSNRQLLVYAYHFHRLGRILKAKTYLNKIDPGYFDSDIYKDLSHSLLVWSMVREDPTLDVAKRSSIYEYFIILKRISESSFKNIEFARSGSFKGFIAQFNRFTKIHVSK